MNQHKQQRQGHHAADGHGKGHRMIMADGLDDGVLGRKQHDAKDQRGNAQQIAVGPHGQASTATEMWRRSRWKM